MIGKNMQDAINDQINAELFSAYLYLSMSAQFESMNLRGMAKWMRVQAGEEVAHAVKFFDHVCERGGKVALAAIDKPAVKWATPLAAFTAAYKHEQKVTALIGKLVDLAAAEDDHASSVFLQWFVSEQVEEEATASAIVEQLKLVGDQSEPLLVLDAELGRRGAD